VGCCAKCRHWNPDADDVLPEHGKCESGKIRTQIEPPLGEDELVILDADLYLFSAVLTGAGFGCVHYEEAEQ